MIFDYMCQRNKAKCRKSKKFIITYQTRKNQHHRLQYTLAHLPLYHLLNPHPCLRQDRHPFLLQDLLCILLSRRLRCIPPILHYHWLPRKLQLALMEMCAVPMQTNGEYIHSPATIVPMSSSTQSVSSCSHVCILFFMTGTRTSRTLVQITILQIASAPMQNIALRRERLTVTHSYVQTIVRCVNIVCTT